MLLDTIRNYTGIYLNDILNKANIS
jgi:hypothetical protein